MKNFWKILPVILCSILMAAHFGRANMLVLQIVSLAIPVLLLWKSKISARLIQIFLILYGFEWIRTLIYYARIRSESGESWLRLAIILGIIAGLNFVTCLVFRTKSMKDRYKL